MKYCFIIFTILSGIITPHAVFSKEPLRQLSPTEKEAFKHLGLYDPDNYLKSGRIGQFEDIQLKDKDWAYLKGLTNLRVVSFISTTNYSDSSIVHLKDLPHLEEVWLDGKNVKGPGLAHLKNISELHLMDLDCSEKLFKSLSSLTDLKHLYIEGRDCEISNKYLSYLQKIKGLKTLVITHCKMEVRCLKWIGKMKQLKSLRLPVLPLLKTFKMDKLDYTYLNNLDGLESLLLTWEHEDTAGLHQLTNLKKLKNFMTRIEGQDKNLVCLKNFPLLTSLGIYSKHTLDDGLLNLKYTPQLESLTLYGNKITSASMKYLSQLKKLKRLDIKGTKVTDDGLKHLGELKSLEWLNISETLVTDKGLKYLHGLKKLKYLEPLETKVDPQGKAAWLLRKELPQLHIEEEPESIEP